MTSEETAGGGGLTGQALIVDLPGGPLFVLLKMPVAGERLASAATLALAPDAAGGIDNYVSAVGNLGGWFGGAEAELPREDWPLMVTFGDINDLKSVKKVDPDSIGVKRILLETTSEDVTSGIEERLPNYGKGSGFDEWYASLAMDDPRRLTLDDFRKSIKR